MDRTDSIETSRGGLTRACRIRQTDRIACVDLPAFPLQLLLRQHPEWRGEPAGVIEEDHPQAPLLWVSESARRVGILPGMRYATGLSVDRNLRAAPVDDQRIARATEALHRHLLRYSPRVEPARHEPGVFWLDAGGLQRVGGTPRAWADRLWRGLRKARFLAGVTVGYSRFGTYCLSRVHRQAAVISSPGRETAACRRVPLARLELPPRLRDDLQRLGLESVGDLMALPQAGLAARFGAETAQLVDLARGLRFDPLQPLVPDEPVRAQEEFEEPETDSWRLLFVLKRMIHPLLARLADEGRAASLVHLDLVESNVAATRRRESLRPAEPSLDAVLLLDLVRLRLESVDLTAGIERAHLELEGAEAPPEALELFRRRPRRDSVAALRAVSRVRAELGDQAVVRAEAVDAHLPEASWRWVPATQLATPRPGPAVGRRPLMRRVLARPRPLLAGPADLARRQGERIVRAASGPGAPPVLREQVRTHGPYLLSGNWWGEEQRRTYHFVEARNGRLLWVYHSGGWWYLQGMVE